LAGAAGSTPARCRLRAARMGDKAKPPGLRDAGGFAVEGLIWINTPRATPRFELCGRAF
jgi:hypothetical protein